MSKMTPEEIKAEIERLQGMLNAQPCTGEEAQGADQEGTEPAGAETPAESGGSTGAAKQGKGRQKRGGPDSPQDSPDRGRAVEGESQTPISHTERPASSLLPNSLQFIGNRNTVETHGTGIAHAHEFTRTTDADLRLEIATELCRQIAEGKSMNAICAEDATMPSRGTFLRWCRDDIRIGQLYDHSLRMRGALYADEIIDLSDRAEKATEAHEVQALKLMVNSRQWVASRLLPKMYGDHQIVEHTGEVKMDKGEIDGRLAYLLQRIQDGKSSA